jgi:hypothetical protein
MYDSEAAHMSPRICSMTGYSPCFRFPRVQIRLQKTDEGSTQRNGLRMARTLHAAHRLTYQDQVIHPDPDIEGFWPKIRPYCTYCQPTNLVVLSVVFLALVCGRWIPGVELSVAGQGSIIASRCLGLEMGVE